MQICRIVYVIHILGQVFTAGAVPFMVSDITRDF